MYPRMWLMNIADLTVRLTRYPEFDEPTLPRRLTFYNFNTGDDEAWFPLVISGSSGLGVDFSLVRGGVAAARGARRVPAARRVPGGRRAVALIWRPLATWISKNRDLKQSRENLKSIEPEHGLGCSIS